MTGDSKNLTPREQREEKLAQRESVRSRIDGRWLVDGIVSTIKTLEAGEEMVGGTAVPLDKGRVASLSVAMQARFKLLAKVLPDLKAVELAGPGGEPLDLQQGMTSTEGAARLLWLLQRAQAKGDVVEGEVMKPEMPDFLK